MMRDGFLAFLMEREQFEHTQKETQAVRFLFRKGAVWCWTEHCLCLKISGLIQESMGCGVMSVLFILREEHGA